MKVLVTGAKGFIGTNLVTRLIKLNRFQIYDYDKSDFDVVDLPELGPFDYIVHLAAETGVLDSAFRKEQVIKTNVLGTLNLLNIKTGRFIFASSCAASNPWSSTYAMSKFFGEHLCASSGIPIVILRFSNVYGPHSLHKQSVVHRFIKNVIDGKPLEIYGSGHQIRSFCYIDDVVEHILEYFYLNPTDIVNISGEVCSINNLAYKILEIAERSDIPPVDIIHTEAKDEVETPDIKHRNCETSLNEGLRKTFRWYMENYNGS